MLGGETSTRNELTASAGTRTPSCIKCLGRRPTADKRSLWGSRKYVLKGSDLPCDCLKIPSDCRKQSNRNFMNAPPSPNAFQVYYR